MKKRENRAQTFTEYAVLVAIVAAVLFGMRIYMERAVQQKYRESADVFGEGEQYAKGVTRAIYVDEPGAPPVTPPSGKNICPGLLSKIGVLEKDIADLNELISSFEQAALASNDSAKDLDEQIPVLRERARELRIQANEYKDKAGGQDAEALRNRKDANDSNTLAGDKNNELAALKRSNPNCYSGCGCTAGSEPACQTMNKIAELEEKKYSLSSKAGEKKVLADAKQADVDFYKTNFPGCFPGDKSCQYINELVAGMEGEISLLRGDEAELNTEAGSKENEANAKKATIPGCYSGSGGSASCEEGDTCCSVFNAAADLELKIADLRSKAALSNTAAALSENAAKDLYGKAASLYKAADDADKSANDLEETQSPELKKRAKELEDKAADARSSVREKEDQIKKFKENYPKCF